VTFGLEILLGIFLGHFLWSTLAGPGAAVVTRLPVVLFFVSALAALGPYRAGVASDPARYLWHAALFVYGIALVLSAWFVWRTEERRVAEPLRLGLPKGFWPAAGYTQLESVVVFAYLNVAPTFVLLWLDVASLAPFYAALRYVALFDGSAAMLTALLAPSLATLDASGLREDAVRQARSALRAAMLFLLPATLLLIFFATPLMGVFNAAFRQHGTLLRIVAVAVLLSPVVHFGGGMLVAFGAYRTYLAASLLYVAAALALLFGLVPTLGLAGAAWCSVLTTSMNAAVVTGALWLRAGVRIPLRVFVAVAVATAAALTAWWVEPGPLLAAALTAGFAAVFAAVAAVTWDEASHWVRRLARHG
jgi:O-antigen/teichoic acid export membrane protein